MTAKKDKKASQIADGYTRFFDTLAAECLLHKVQLLYGDWNMSLLVVKDELKTRNLEVDLCAWMPMAQPDNKPWFDSCSMFLVGGCQEPPVLQYGLRASDRGGGEDGVEYIFDGSGGLAAIAEQDDEEAEAEAAVAAEGREDEQKKPPPPLLQILMKDGAQLKSFMPAAALTGKKKETELVMYHMNREALVRMLQPVTHLKHAWGDKLVPAWPGVKQKVLDKSVYDGPGSLLMTGSHVPIACVTAVPSHRSPEREKARKVESQRRRARKEQRGSTERSDSVPTVASPEYIGGQVIKAKARSASQASSRKWPPRQQAQQSRRHQAHGAPPPPAPPGAWQADRQRLGDTAQPMAPPAAPYYNASRGGGELSASHMAWAYHWCSTENPWYPGNQEPAEASQSRPAAYDAAIAKWHHGI